MISLDATTRAAYDAATSSNAKAQVVLDALGPTVVVVVYDGATVMGSGDMQGAWASVSGSVLTMGDVASFLVLVDGTPNAATWFIRWEGAGRWCRAPFGPTGDFTWSQPTFVVGNTGTIGTATASVPIGNVSADLGFAYDIASAVVVWGWKATSDVTLAASLVGTAMTYDLAQEANLAGQTPRFTIPTPVSGVTIHQTTGLLTKAAGVAVNEAGHEVYVDLVAEVATAEADWIARSTGPGVVWAHDFRSDAERTQFLWTDQGPMWNGIRNRLVADHPVPGGAGKSLEAMTLGAILTTDFGTAATSCSFDDLTDWPTGDFYFFMGGNPNTGRGFHAGFPYNLFYCPAGGRSGNTLSGLVHSTPAPAGSSSYSQTRGSWLTGDSAGHEVQAAWVRNFSPMSSGNGLGVADINRPGLTARAWTPIQQSTVHSKWGYAYYGHADNHGETWTAPRAGSGPTHADCWNGTEFYLQMRVRVDPRFWNNHAPVDQSQTWWLNKFFMIQTQQSSSQQLSPFLSSKNKWYVPGNAGPPFGWFEHQSDGRLEVGGSYQPGGPWAATANITNTPKPATGQATPDGSSAWSYPDDWVTLLFYVRPGHSGVADTFLEVKAAHRNQPYVTLWSGLETITFNTSTDLSGYCGIFLQSYLNITITASQNQIPRKSHFRRWAQIIFSHQTIAAPGTGA